MLILIPPQHESVADILQAYLLSCLINDYLTGMKIYFCVFLLIILMYIMSVLSCLINEYLTGMKIYSYAFFTHLNYAH